MLGHSSIEQTSTYLNVVAAGLRASMAKSDAARCNPVAIPPATELPLPCNDAEIESEKTTIN